MSTRTADWELTADERGPVLRRAGREYDPSALPLSDSAVRALREWGEVLAAFGESAGDGGEPGHQDEVATAVLTDRARVLAARVAAELGSEVDCVDPLSGRVLHAGPAGRPPAEEPVPWWPGLFVSVVFGAIVAVVLVVVSRGLADVNVVLAVVVNLAVAAGFAPSVWIGRGVPTWRWIAWGTGGGVLAAWVALLLGLLGG